ncbi:uncharacterized protein CCOS01_00977 [Colletotrichum costaricense]|uniref:Uncharacterized protein n=1 Tax=Colletotrichum costaricense TaxID=1209916 RepID=A0AAI9ZAJ3_9PEZI|nr:uncharacterized protein CCOS01_00977 [Colletotrichum costaricense]KAK1539663.1 hypothetical protein CCOS01_00977 [Colletotrichum costaricense]
MQEPSMGRNSVTPKYHGTETEVGTFVSDNKVPLALAHPILSVEHRNLDFWPRIVPAAAPKQHHHLPTQPWKRIQCRKTLPESSLSYSHNQCHFAIHGYQEVLANFTPTTRTAEEENLSRQVFLVVDALPTRLSTARVTGVATAKNFATEVCPVPLR